MTAEIYDISKAREARRGRLLSTIVAERAVVPWKMGMAYLEAINRSAVEFQRANERALVEAGMMPLAEYRKRWGPS